MMINNIKKTLFFSKHALLRIRQYFYCFIYLNLCTAIFINKTELFIVKHMQKAYCAYVLKFAREKVKTESFTQMLTTLKMMIRAYLRKDHSPYPRYCLLNKRKF